MERIEIKKYVDGDIDLLHVDRSWQGSSLPIASSVHPDWAARLSAVMELIEVAESVVLRGHADGCSVHTLAKPERRHCGCLVEPARKALEKAGER